MDDEQIDDRADEDGDMVRHDGPSPVYSYLVRLPKDRVAVLIGKKGKIKREIEQEAGIRLQVDSKEGEVTVSGKDALRLYTAREIIKAIARGFNPDIALLLLKPDYLFELIDLTDHVSTKNHLLRLKGRIIGAEGKSRRIIEELTDVHISVYGKTVCLLGEAERIPIARRAMDSLIKGAPHAKVYQFLEKMQAKMRRGLSEREDLSED